VFRSLGRQSRGRGRVGEERAERPAVEEVVSRCLVSNTRDAGLRPCRRASGCSEARFSSRRSGPAGRLLDDADEKESNGSSRAKSVDLLFISRWRLCARGCPKDEV
jgi:hypothetical protein